MCQHPEPRQQDQFSWQRKEVTITLCDVPGNATKKDLAGIEGVLVVPGGQLTAPGEGGFVHS